jgi:Response receiver domain
MANEHYASFISEAFIKPIRSVLIVDDDYPTIDDMLNIEIERTEDNPVARVRKTWYDAPQRIKNVIERFRHPDQPLLVDIHDGANVAAEGDAMIASHLHQSDLLVLDYELDKTRRGDGYRAIEILRGLMSNDHFNLVVVHTSEELNLVYRQIIVGLLSPIGTNLTDDERDRATQLVAVREDIEEDIAALLEDAVSDDQYVHWRLYPSDYSRILTRKEQPYTAFAELADAANWSDEDLRLVLRLELARVEARLQPVMNQAHPTSISWSNRGVRWIKTNSDFIAFSKKGADDDLLKDLQLALEAWNPEPSRLFLAKLRAEIDEYGVIAQTSALERKHALAHWYAGLLKADEYERRWRIAESVERHSDQLLHSILPRVEEFATKLVKAEAAGGDINARCKDHFGVDLSDAGDVERASLEHNAFVCSRDPQGWHLTTGHILDVSGDYWICLSPACDLVPGQGAKRFEIFGNRRPFVAVKLFLIDDKPLRKIKVQSNMHVFLVVDGKTKIFAFTDKGNEAAVPISRTFYAEKDGVFHCNFAMKVSIPRAGSSRLVHDSVEATVVSQLRYEYALNLLQKLGVSMTRIGLDFVGGA